MSTFVEPKYYIKYQLSCYYQAKPSISKTGLVYP